MIAWISKAATGLWLKIAGAAVAVAMVIGMYAAVRRGGRDAQRAEDGAAALRRTQDANRARAQAARKPTPQEEANDPFNRDVR